MKIQKLTSKLNELSTSDNSFEFTSTSIKDLISEILHKKIELFHGLKRKLDCIPSGMTFGEDTAYTNKHLIIDILIYLDMKKEVNKKTTKQIQGLKTELKKQGFEIE